MTSIDSPAAARRRLRLALRTAREATGLTQAQVADELDWSVSKVNRIENGEVTISLTDVRALLGLLRVTDTAQVEELTRDARTARKRGWWDEPDYRPHFTAALLQLTQFEAEATTIRSFQPTLIPGVLQTPDYARAILEVWNDLPPETMAARQRLRARRSQELFGRQPVPTYLLVLDESAILREVGGAAVMAEQLQALLESIESYGVILRIVPLVDGAAISTVGGFTILNLGTEENAIMYQEAVLDDTITDAHDMIERYRHTFEKMWELALSPAASTRLVDAHVASLLASLDRAKRGGKA
jgi:transcriptional regulator with XRE-family HTH domain